RQYQASVIGSGLTPYLGGSLDARSALWQARSKSQPADRVDFIVTRPGGAVEDLGPLTPPGTPPGAVAEITNFGGLGIDPAGQSDDLTRVLFRMHPDDPSSGYHFWPFDTTFEGS